MIALNSAQITLGLGSLVYASWGFYKLEKERVGVTLVKLVTLYFCVGCLLGMLYLLSQKIGGADIASWLIKATYAPFIIVANWIAGWF